MNLWDRQKPTKPAIAGLIAVTALIAGAVYLWARLSSGSPQPATDLGSPRKLVFRDEFNGGSLDTSKWNTCYDNYDTAHDGCTNFGNDESEWYKPSQVSVRDGNLVLQALRQTTPGKDKTGKPTTYEFVSGMISSGRFLEQTPAKWTGTYGYYEAKINVPDGQAVWPAFWLLPVNHTWPPEIDVMEVLGHKPNELLTTYFWPGPNDTAAKDSSTYEHSSSLSGSWHIYSVDWQPEHINWYLDGKLVKHVSSDHIPTVPMSILLNLAVGGRLPGYPDQTTPASPTMLVDYVRVFQ